MSFGYLSTYVIVLLPTMACVCAGGALIGSAFAVLALLASALNAFFFPSKPASFLVAGIVVAIFPASYTGSQVVIYQELLSAVKTYGKDDLGIALGDTMNNEHNRADVFALKNLDITNFRYDLMGQAHETLPLYDAKYKKKAGKDEEGTYCAVPVVVDTWNIDLPVTFWCVHS